MSAAAGAYFDLAIRVALVGDVGAVTARMQLIITTGGPRTMPVNTRGDASRQHPLAMPHAGAGKTSLLVRFCEDTFTTKTASTIGVGEPASRDGCACAATGRQ